jgi:hypothetical protein
VVLDEGAEVACDAALVAVGVEAETGLAGPAVPPIHVCGDAAGGAGHWTSAAASGASTARVLLGLKPLPPAPSFFWSDQFGLRLQLVGSPRGSTVVELDGATAPRTDGSSLHSRRIGRRRSRRFDVS